MFADTPIAGPMFAIWLLLTSLPRLGRRCPPIIGTLLVGALATILLGRLDASMPLKIEFIKPVIQAPTWSPAAMIELVVPLTITVLAIQNAQGFAILKAAGYSPPIGAVTIACGIGSAVCALVGGVSTCLTGPANAIIVASGDRRRQYTSGIFVGLLAIMFGVLAPTFTRLLLIAPKSLVTVLAGLAMLRVLQAAFITAFKERFSLGALVAFLVTMADAPILNIGAAFWGLVSGVAIIVVLERADFAAKSKSNNDPESRRNRRSRLASPQNKLSLDRRLGVVVGGDGAFRRPHSPRHLPARRSRFLRLAHDGRRVAGTFSCLPR